MTSGCADFDPLPDVVSAQGLTGCIDDGGTCGKKIVGRGRCRKHYGRWWTATRGTERPPAMNLRTKTPEQRFETKVRRCGADECWPFTGSTDKFGHGQFFVSRERGRVPAHSYALEISGEGPCPEGREACHRCDNPPCCNPAHIYFGTRQQNVDDMYRRGRARAGVANAKLAEPQIVAIRERFAAGEQLADIAADFEIGTGHVSRIANGLMWKGVGGPVTSRGHRGRPTDWSNN